MKNKAFTLIELLVVVGIIALLVSILIPSLNSAVGRPSAGDQVNTPNGVGTFVTTDTRTHPSTVIVRMADGHEAHFGINEISKVQQAETPRRRR